MGLFFSCCRRQKHRGEREPLLPKHRANSATADEYLPSKEQVIKIADIVAALRTGKLPSQQQLHKFLQSLLRSIGPHPSYGHLSEPGRHLVLEFKELLEVLLITGIEKNDDSILQEIVHQLSKIPSTPVHADIIVSAEGNSTLDIQDIAGEIPSKDQATSDTRELVMAIRQLIISLLTSSALRVILYELFNTARETAADLAADVGRVATAVEVSAVKVEEALRPEDITLEDIRTHARDVANELAPEGSAISEETGIRWQHPGDDSLERVKDAAVKRLQQIMAEVHSHSQYGQALRTIMYLLQDYTSRVNNIATALEDTKTPTITPIFWTDPHLSKAISLISSLVSRFASRHSVDRWVDCLRAVVLDVGTLPPGGLETENNELHRLRGFLTELGSWLNLALDSPQYATSPAGQRDVEALYDDGRRLLNEAARSDKPWAQHIRDLIHETDELLKAFGSDQTTNRFITAISTFSTSLTNYTRSLADHLPGVLEQSKRRIHTQIQQDVLQWLLPRILRALHVIPVPRVEYRSNSLDAAIDALYLTPASAQLSLIPDSIRIQNWTEILLDMREVHPEVEPILPAIEYNSMKTHTMLRVSMKGIRVSARDIAFYACYRLFGKSKWFSWFGYEDEGLVSVDVGSRGAKDEGLSIDFELEFLPEDEDGEEHDGEPSFLVRDVQVDLPGLRLSLDRSKHWILNKALFQPLAGPFGRVAAAWVLRNQVRALLESLAVIGKKVVRDAQESARSSRRNIQTGDYVDALWGILTNPAEEETADHTMVEADEETPLVETQTTVTTKGIIRTSVTFPVEATEVSENPMEPVEESALAIGIGEQILPGKGGPYDDGHDEEQVEYGPRELARDALDQIQSRVEEAVTVENVVRRTGELRREADNAAKKTEQRESCDEIVEGGWRSDAFML